MQQLSPIDAAFLYLENDSTHAHGTFVWIYDAGRSEPDAISRRALLDHMRARLQVSPVFTRRIHRLPLDFDYPYWVDDEGFELLYHVRELNMPEGGQWDDFCGLVSEVHSRPLEPSRPLWELNLVRGLDGIPELPERCFAILGKFHHVAIDGATGMHIIEQIHDCPMATVNPDAPLSRPARQPGLRESLFRAAVRNVGALDKGLDLLRPRRDTPQDGHNETASTATAVIEAPAEPAGVPQTLFNKAVDAQATWDCRTYDLAAIKSLRKLADGATVNDVLLTLVAGGLRHYLAAQDQLPEAPMKAGCPVNIRTEQEAATGGNMISAIIVNMHTDIEAPIERLAAITRSSSAAKQRATQQGSRKVMDVIAIVPAQAQALLGHAVGAVSRTLNRAVKFNCSVSNLPGPQQQLQMLGGRLHSIGAAMPVMNGYGLFVGITTCTDRLSISMSSCSGILPDAAELGDCMDRSFRELQSAARPRNVQRKRNKA
jgi:WS/DGAT/MGAT family acyltransferase